MLHLLHQFSQLCTEAGGLGFVIMHDGVFMQRIQLLLACAGLPSSVRLCFGELGKRRMRSSLPSGKSATPPARCIHRPQRDTSSAEYRLLVSRASSGASREPESCRSPALAPHTCAVSPTFRYGAFLFVAFALADASSARLTTPGGKSVSYP